MQERTTRIVKTPLIIDSKNNAFIPERFIIKNEKWLQTLLPQHPEILPTMDVDLDNENSKYKNLFYIANEASVESTKLGKGHIDIIYLSSAGNLVLVETKLYRNPESSREVIGQILDYAANVRASNTWNWDMLCKLYGGKDLYADMHKRFPDIAPKDDFMQTVNINIRNADFLMMIVGDSIKPSLENIKTFIESPIDMKYRLALCELTTYKVGGNILVVPRLTTSTRLIERSVISIQSGYIVAKEPETPKRQTSGYQYFEMPLEEFVTKFIGQNKNTSPETLMGFFDDLHNAGFELKTSTKSITIRIPNKMALIEFSFNDMYFVPSRLNKRIKGPHATSALNYFLECIKPFLTEGQNPYKKMDKFYFIDLKVLNSKRKEFITALTKFKSFL